MFRVGDKVVCVSDMPLYSHDKLDIFNNCIYTVVDEYKQQFVLIFETDRYYSLERFVLLSEMRKKKIKQLNKYHV